MWEVVASKLCFWNRCLYFLFQISALSSDTSNMAPIWMGGEYGVKSSSLFYRKGLLLPLEERWGILSSECDAGAKTGQLSNVIGDKSFPIQILTRWRTHRLSSEGTYIILLFFFSLKMTFQFNYVIINFKKELILETTWNCIFLLLILKSIVWWIPMYSSCSWVNFSCENRTNVALRSKD